MELIKGKKEDETKKKIHIIPTPSAAPVPEVKGNSALQKKEKEMSVSKYSK